MRRLIDEDDVIAVLANHHFDDDKGNFDLLIHNLCKEVRLIPTAHDVDAVVRKLDELRHTDVCEQVDCRLCPYTKSCDITSDETENLIFDKVIEIVKGGGS